MSRNKLTAIECVVEKQRSRLDAAGARMGVLKIRRHDARVLNVTCCKKMALVQKNFAADFEKVVTT